MFDLIIVMAIIFAEIIGAIIIGLLIQGVIYQLTGFNIIKNFDKALNKFDKILNEKLGG